MAPAPIGIAFGTINGLSDDELQSSFDKIADIGFTKVRFSTNWTAVESKPGVYHTDKIEQIAAWLAERELTGLGVMGYTPRFYLAAGVTTSNSAPPVTRYDAWRAYCNVLFTAGVRCGLTDFEPWNEPNLSAFFLEPNAVVFARLVIIAREEAQKVTAATGVKIRLIVGATSPAKTVAHRSIHPPDFIKTAYAVNGLKAAAAAVSMHTYMGTADADTRASWSTMMDQWDEVDAFLTSIGQPHKPIWATEFGYRTNGPSGVVTEAEQARKLVKQVEVFWTRPRAGAGFIFNLQDLGTWDINGFLGIYRQDGTPKPAVAALKSVLA